MTDLTITQEQYEALVALARAGAAPDKLRDIDNWLLLIEQQNGIKRSFLLIQWQEQDQPLPPAVRFPETWPPNMRYALELTSREICRDDVDKVLKKRASRPTNVLVTKDPGGTLGWTQLEVFFANG